MSGWYRLDDGFAIGTVVGIFAVVFLFGIFFQLNKMFMPESPHLNLKETRRKLLPLCILTSVHTLLFLLYMIFEAYRSGRSNINATADVLCRLYLFSPLVLLLFSIIYPIVLVERHRMNRFLGAAAAIYTVNLLIQAVIAFLVWAHAQGG